MKGKDWGLLLGGFAIGTVGIAALKSKPAQNLYVQGIAAGMRVRNGYQDLVEQAKAQVDDMVAEANYVNTKKAGGTEAGAAEAEAE